MDSENSGENGRGTGRAWAAAAVFALLFLACLALLVFAQGVGFGPEGQKTYIRVEAAVNNYPFCPPRVPCPISRVMERNYATVWLVREKETAGEVETNWQTLVSIPLW